MEIALRDLAAGRKLVGDVSLSSQASFFSQQSAEKVLKGFLVWHQTRFDKEHDLRYLGNLAVQKDPTLQSAVDEASALNPFAVTFRYPGESDGPTAEDAVEALDIAQKNVRRDLASAAKGRSPVVKLFMLPSRVRT
jgi:HEPN domain-containing protein